MIALTSTLVNITTILGGGFMNNLSENDVINKEAILEKSRQLKQDEGIEHAKARGFKLGDVIASFGVAIPLIIFSLITGQYVTVFALGAYVFAFFFGESLAIYRFTQKKSYLVYTIGAAIFAIISIVKFVTTVLNLC
jgi:Zn-dependent protease